MRKFKEGDVVRCTNSGSGYTEGDIHIIADYQSVSIEGEFYSVEAYDSEDFWISSDDFELVFSEGAEVKSVELGSALDKQISGTHYKDCAIQPIEYIHANGLDYFEGNAVKYITRHRKKNGKADLEKAIHYLELLIELEYKEE